MKTLLLAAALAAGLSADSLEALRGFDLRLATIGHRLVTGNVALCRERAPATGLVLHAVTQYDAATVAAARAAFRFDAPVSVEAVVAGSPADRAGIRADDGLVAIDGVPVTAGTPPPGSADRDAALAMLAASRLRLDLVRRGAVTLAAPPGCAARFEVVLGPKLTAETDGHVVQLGVLFLERYTDAEVAVVAAHELAHAILRHRVRMEAAGVKRGIAGELGRNARLSQRAEIEADRLGVHLLYNAGYDPASAARFWQAHGGDVDGGLFRSRTHPATRARIAAITAEATTLATHPPRPSMPPLLEERDRPFE